MHLGFYSYKLQTGKRLHEKIKSFSGFKVRALFPSLKNCGSLVEGSVYDAQIPTELLEDKGGEGVAVCADSGSRG